MKYKAVICDMDGTLLNSDHDISNFTKDTIFNLLNKGIHFILATGRPRPDIDYFINKLNLNTYTITANGAAIHDKNNLEIFSSGIPTKYVQEILNTEIKEEIHKNIYYKDKWFVEKQFKELLKIHKHSGFEYTLIDFDEIKDKEPHKIFFIHRDHNLIFELEHEMRNKFEKDLSITSSVPTCLEIMQKDINKGKAMLEVSNYLNINPEEIVCFGDGLNDYEMLSMVGQSFIVENASQRLKDKLPNTEIIGNCNEDSVAKKIREIFF